MNINFLKGSPIQIFCRKKDYKLWQYLVLYVFLAMFFFGIAVLTVELDQGEMVRKGAIERSFYNDVNYWVILLFTIPILILVSVKLRWLIPRSVETLEKQGIISFRQKNDKLAISWNRWIRRFTWIAYAIAVVWAIIMLPPLFRDISSNPAISYQYRDAGVLVLPGYWFLFSILILHFVVAQVLILIILEVFFLWRLVKKHVDVHIHILHPDGLGGFRPITHISYANQMAGVVLGINLSAVLYIWFFAWSSNNTDFFIFLSVIICCVYLIISFLIFFGPLMIFRKCIREGKKVALQIISKQYNRDFSKLLSTEPFNLTSEDAENLRNINELYTQVKKMPSWPMDWGIRKNFVLTLLSSAVPALVKIVYETIII